MKQCKSKFVKQILTGICCICILLGNSLLVYAGSGSIEIVLKEPEGNNSDYTNVTFAVYQVGTIEDGQPKLDSIYGILEYPQTAEETNQAAKKLKSLVKGEEPVLEGKTNESGVVRFENLEDGVYVIIATEASHYGIIEPVILHLPYYEEVNGMMSGPHYQVRMEPKATFNPDQTETDQTETDQTETDQTETDQTETDQTETDQTETDQKDKNTSKKTTTKKTGKVKTGDTTEYMGYLALLMLSVMIVGKGILEKRRVKENLYEK